MEKNKREISFTNDQIAFLTDNFSKYAITAKLFNRFFIDIRPVDMVKLLNKIIASQEMFAIIGTKELTRIIALRDEWILFKNLWYKMDDGLIKCPFEWFNKFLYMPLEYLKGILKYSSDVQKKSLISCIGNPDFHEEFHSFHEDLKKRIFAFTRESEQNLEIPDSELISGKGEY